MEKGKRKQTKGNLNPESFKTTRNIVKIETNGSGPIIEKRGRAKGSNSSKKENDWINMQGNKKMEEHGHGACGLVKPIP